MGGFGKVKILVEKSVNELNINPYLHSDLHDRVYMQCVRCNEIFLREIKETEKLHACPNHTVKDKTIYRLCNSCGEMFTLDKFNGNSYRCIRCSNSHIVGSDIVYDYSNNASVRCEVKLLHKDAVIPKRSKLNDAGLDINSIVNVTLKPAETLNIDTGVIISAPPGYYFTIEGRSSLFKMGIFPLRGIIDATYTGEMKVALFNGSNKSYTIEKGDRVAQLILHKIYCPDIIMVEDFSPEYNQRGTDGYGSTGK